MCARILFEDIFRTIPLFGIESYLTICDLHKLFPPQGGLLKSTFLFFVHFQLSLLFCSSSNLLIK